MTDTPTAANNNAEHVEEIWTYIGVRAQDGDVEHHWLDAGGKTKVFTKFKAPIVAAKYRLLVQHKADDSVSVVPDPKFVELEPDEAKRRGIVAEHRANETAAEAWRVAKKETTEAIDNMTIRELRAKLHRLPVTRRRALLAIAIDRLQTGKVE
jgi:hypothetical protein